MRDDLAQTLQISTLVRYARIDSSVRIVAAEVHAARHAGRFTDSPIRGAVIPEAQRREAHARRQDKLNAVAAFGHVRECIPARRVSRGRRETAAVATLQVNFNTGKTRLRTAANTVQIVVSPDKVAALIFPSPTPDPADYARATQRRRKPRAATGQHA